MPAPGRILKSHAACLALALAGLAAGWPGASPAQDTYDEDSVKAAFIYHFSTFVAWPESSADRGEFVIAVLGDDDIADELARYLPGHTLQGRAMRARRIESIEELDDEEVVFIGAGRNHSLARDLSAIGDRPMLVVTDAEDALDHGSMINFRVVDQRVRFEISLPAAERAGLVLSSRLLAAAMHVDTTSGIVTVPGESMISRWTARPSRAHRPGRGRMGNRHRRQRRRS